MKANILFGVLCALAALAACTKEKSGLESSIGENTQSENSICCIPPVSTRTAYGTAQNNVYPIVWSEGDAVQLVSADGSSSAIYTLSSDSGSTLGTFTSEMPVLGADRLCIYPASSLIGTDANGNPQVSLAGLTQQSYSDNLADNASNVSLFPLWATESKENPGHFAMNNICGGLSLQLTDYQGFGVKVTDVEIVSASRFIAGTATIDKATGVVSLSGTESQKSIKMSNPEGKLISVSPARTIHKVECFYITLPAGTYPAGDLTFKITDNKGRVFTKNVTSEVVVKPGIAKRMAQLRITTYFGKANCIIVNPGQTVEFDAGAYYTLNRDYGYEGMPVKDVNGGDYDYSDAFAEPVWELVAAADAYSEGSVLGSYRYSDGRISVTAKNVEGNAVLALKHEGTVLWSWHIWVTDTPQDLVFSNVNACGTFQDRHLGATNNSPCSLAAGSVNLDCLGLLYQFGRKDPFACGLQTYNKVLFSSVSVSKENGNIAFTIQNPNTRLLNSASKNHWYIGTTDDGGDDLSFWGCTMVHDPAKLNLEQYNKEADAPKTVYDPCPEGYRVPEAKYMYFVKDQNASYYGSPGNGYNVKYDGVNTNYWAPCGFILHGTDVITATSGSRAYRISMWSASGNMNYSIRMFAASYEMSLKTDEKYGRAAALGIRCRKIMTASVGDINQNSNLEHPEDE